MQITNGSRLRNDDPPYRSTPVPKKPRKQKDPWKQTGKRVEENGIDLDFLVLENPTEHPNCRIKYRCVHCNWEYSLFMFMSAQDIIDSLVFHYDRCPERLEKLNYPLHIFRSSNPETY